MYGEKIRKVIELHEKGLKDISNALKKYSDYDKSIINDHVEIQSKLNEELKIFTTTLTKISDSLSEIIEDWETEQFYLKELEETHDDDYIRYLVKEYSLVLGRLYENNEIIEENFKRIKERWQNWNELFDKLESIIALYPKLKENMEEMWRIMAPIVEG